LELPAALPTAACNWKPPDEPEDEPEEDNRRREKSPKMISPRTPGGGELLDELDAWSVDVADGASRPESTECANFRKKASNGSISSLAELSLPFPRVPPFPGPKMAPRAERTNGLSLSAAADQVDADQFDALVAA